MKHIRLFPVSLIALVALVSYQSPALAKNDKESVFSMPRNELSVTYGYYTLPYAVGSISELYKKIVPDSKLQFKDMKSSGAISLEYYYNFGRHFALGLNASIEGLNASVSQDGGVSYIPKVSCAQINFGPSCKFRWFDLRIFSMYSKLGAELGCTNFEDKQTSFSFVPQIIPIGAEIGFKHVRAFVELLGIGGTGFLAGGISVRF